ncbi:GtrA family protein [Paenibacillus sp. F411]|nr:GtrA family protein [Paenibacillus sp. F411]
MKNLLLKLSRSQNVLFNFIQYGIVGAIGTLVHTVILAACVEYLNLSPVLSTVIGFVFSLVISYKLNSIWTFKNRGEGVNRFLKYTITCSYGLLVNILIMYMMVNVLHYSYMLGQLIAVMVVPIINYSLSRYWVFNKKKAHKV